MCCYECSSTVFIKEKTGKTRARWAHRAFLFQEKGGRTPAAMLLVSARQASIHFI